jgi:choline-sulfatase
MYDPAEIILPSTFGIVQPGAQPGIRPEWPEENWRKIIAAYCGNISAIDKQVGLIIKALKDKGLWENTLIVFTSDHGDHMGDFSQLGKGTMLESSVRVPLIIKTPGKDNPGKRNQQVVNLIDLYRTFLDYAIMPAASYSADSRSVRKLLEGDIKWENQTFSSIGSADGKNGQVMFIMDSLKCVGFLKNGEMKTELYNRSESLTDLHNLAGDPKYTGIISDMKEVLGKWTESLSGGTQNR